MADAAVQWHREQGKDEAEIERAVLYFPQREQLQEQLPSLLQPGDVILVKGSNGMKMSQIAEQIRGMKAKEQ